MTDDGFTEGASTVGTSGHEHEKDNLGQDNDFDHSNLSQGREDRHPVTSSPRSPYLPKRDSGSAQRRVQRIMSTSISEKGPVKDISPVSKAAGAQEADRPPPQSPAVQDYVQDAQLGPRTKMSSHEDFSTSTGVRSEQSHRSLRSNRSSENGSGKETVKPRNSNDTGKQSPDLYMEDPESQNAGPVRLRQGNDPIHRRRGIDRISPLVSETSGLKKGQRAPRPLTVEEVAGTHSLPKDEMPATADKEYALPEPATGPEFSRGAFSKCAGIFAKVKSSHAGKSEAGRSYFRAPYIESATTEASPHDTTAHAPNFEHSATQEEPSTGQFRSQFASYGNTAKEHPSGSGSGSGSFRSMPSSSSGREAPKTAEHY